MRINIKGNWYDGDKENIITVELSPKDRTNIANMSKDATLYCSFNYLFNSADKVNSFLDTLKAESK
jgi:hypothetical protein